MKRHRPRGRHGRASKRKQLWQDYGAWALAILITILYQSLTGYSAGFNLQAGTPVGFAIWRENPYRQHVMRLVQSNLTKLTRHETVCLSDLNDLEGNIPSLDLSAFSEEDLTSETSECHRTIDGETVNFYQDQIEIAVPQFKDLSVGDTVIIFGRVIGRIALLGEQGAIILDHDLQVSLDRNRSWDRIRFIYKYSDVTHKPVAEVSEVKIGAPVLVAKKLLRRAYSTTVTAVFNDGSILDEQGEWIHRDDYSLVR